jgi:hypothetical protein
MLMLMLNKIEDNHRIMLIEKEKVWHNGEGLRYNIRILVVVGIEGEFEGLLDGVLYIL